METSPGDGVGQGIRGTGDGGGSGSKDKGKDPEEGMGSHGGGGLGELASLPLYPTHYDRNLVQQCIAESNWTILEQYLISGVLGLDLTEAAKYASITFLIRREALREIITTKGKEKANTYFKSKVRPLVRCSSEYINGERMKEEIDDVAKEINTGEVPALSHLQRDIEDFFKLYHTEICGAPDRPERGRSPLWDFATRTFSEIIEVGKKPRPNFRCLACGRVFENGPTISVMKDHFLSGPLCGKCPKVTQNILKRLQQIYPKDDILQVVDAPEQQIEVEEQQDSLLVRSIKEVQVRVRNVYEKKIITDNDRSEANRELREAYNILDQCVLMAETGGVSVINNAPEALPYHNSGGAGITSLSGQNTEVFIPDELLDGTYASFEPYYFDGTGTSETSQREYQMPRNALQDQLPLASYMHTQQISSQAYHVPYEGSSSFHNPAQASGLSELADHGAHESLNLQITPSPVGTHLTSYEQYYLDGIGTPETLHPAYQMTPNGPPASYIHAQQRFGQAFQDPQHGGSSSFHNPTHASGLMSEFADQGAQNNLNLQSPVNPVGTQETSSYEQYYLDGIGTSGMSHPTYQMTPNGPPDSYMHAQQRFGQAFQDPQHEGSLSFHNPTQASGLMSEFADQGAQNSLNLQIPVNPVGTQETSSGSLCPHGMRSQWDCQICFGCLD